jgi:hypothetical protein
MPQLKLWLVGRDPPASVLALRHCQGVTVTGGVPDLAPLYARASLALVPLRAGGGTRIKLLEALATACRSSQPRSALPEFRGANPLWVDCGDPP